MQALSINPISIHSPTPSLHDGSPLNSPLPRPLLTPRSPHSNPNFSRLPPLVTAATARASNIPRPLSQADRLYSAHSHISSTRTNSRPHSHVFPIFHSSLTYTLVRDFAYQPDQQLHYGPQQRPSKPTSPVQDWNDQEEDEAEDRWYETRSRGSDTPLRQSGPRLPATSFNDGPPWNEDEDLLSPIVTSSRHRKGKSSSSDVEHERGRAWTKGSGNNQKPAEVRPVIYSEYSETIPQDDDIDQPDYFALQRTPSYVEDPTSLGSEDDPTPSSEQDDVTSRYSRDYQFTIASPDEEMHGKAVALFDFARENENELPLLEGQVLWVSYRHGQGWLVAQDPKSGETGLVPEEYVRLVRDIEGGLTRLQSIEAGEWEGSPIYGLSSEDSPMSSFPSAVSSGVSGGIGTLPSPVEGGAVPHHYTPVQSHFSTSSRDLERYTQHHLLLANQAGPPSATSQTAVSPPIHSGPFVTDGGLSNSTESSRGSLPLGKPLQLPESEIVKQSEIESSATQQIPHSQISGGNQLLPHPTELSPVAEESQRTTPTIAQTMDTSQLAARTELDQGSTSAS